MSTTSHSDGHMARTHVSPTEGFHNDLDKKHLYHRLWRVRILSFEYQAEQTSSPPRILKTRAKSSHINLRIEVNTTFSAFRSAV